MNKFGRGYTIVEVALFLAITGLLFIGVAIGVQSSIFQQRYNDSVQNFAEFLRSLYSQVTNVENISTTAGRSNKAIYGKLVTFGEEWCDDTDDENDDYKVCSYTVVGNVDGDYTTSDSTLKIMSVLGIDIVVENDSEKNQAGIIETYTPRWGAKIENTNNEPFQGALLIVRHPRSGTVFTFFDDWPKDDLKRSVKEEEGIKVMNYGNVSGVGGVEEGALEGMFELRDVDFCINPTGSSNGVRRDIRIKSGARNASGVEIIDQNSEDNKCNKKEGQA